MPDTKITALAAIVTVDPAVDVLPIVDVSDTSMAASGTTKKITSNQLLGAGGTATLASATITGDLTVATSVLKVDSANTRVGINTTTINGGPFNVKISSAIDAKFVVQDGFTTGNVRLAAVDNAYSTYKIMDYSALSHAWYNSGSTAMTLNSTGLGVGAASPSYKLHLAGAPAATSGALAYLRDTTANGSNNSLCSVFFSSSPGTDFYIGKKSTSAVGSFSIGNGGTGVEYLGIDSSGNVGIGVTPSAWNAGYRALELGSNVGSFSATTGIFDSALNAYFNTSNQWIYKTTAAVTLYRQQTGQHQWFNAPSGTAGNAITFTQAMTLDASGNLLVGTTVISPNINGAGAITAKGLAGITTQTVSALLTDYTLPIGAFSGILTIRSNAAGGSAVWMLDPNAGAVSISNNIIGRTITFTFSGGSWKMQQTVGTVPSTYNYLVLATQ